MSIVQDIQRLRAIKGKKITTNAALSISIHVREALQLCVEGKGTTDSAMTVSVFLAWMWELCGTRQIEARKMFTNVQRIWGDMVDQCSEYNTKAIDMSHESIRTIHDSLMIIESIISLAGREALRQALLNVRNTLPTTAKLVDILERYLLEEAKPVRNPIFDHLSMV